MGPALPRPYHARGEAGEEVPLLVAAVVLEMKLMAVMTVAKMLTATVAAAATMPAAGGRVTRSRERGGERYDGNDGNEEWARGAHGLLGG
jgi:uncharacterized membrane protein